MRVTPSMLDSFGLLKTEEWMTQERLLQQLLEPFRETFDMKVGTAIHLLLENGTPTEGIPIDQDSLFTEMHKEFSPDELKYMQHEMWGEGVINTVHGPCDVKTKADGALGSRLYDWKCSKKKKRYEDYADSMQWKLMAMILGFPMVDYGTIQWKIDKKTSLIKIVGVQRFPFVWSDSMEREVRSTVDELISFCKRVGHPELLYPKPRNHQ